MLQARGGARTESRTRTDYVETGIQLLAEGGVRAVTIANLCQRLGVTKGSFYHHFDSVEDFRHRMLTHWAGERERQVLEAAAAEPDPIARLDVLARSAIALPHEAEAAIRAWSREDQHAWRVRAGVDAARATMVAQAYIDAGVPPDAAALIGEASVALLIGAQERHERTDRELLTAMFDWIERAALREAGIELRPDRALTTAEPATVNLPSGTSR